MTGSNPSNGRTVTITVNPRSSMQAARRGRAGNAQRSDQWHRVLQSIVAALEPVHSRSGRRRPSRGAVLACGCGRIDADDRGWALAGEEAFRALELPDRERDVTIACETDISLERDCHHRCPG